jgi:WD40 repeat protein/serine/threonine protein kinase
VYRHALFALIFIISHNHQENNEFPGVMSSQVSNSLVGTLIKGYELRELIGQGGFGAVYRAYQAQVEREVAVKIILPEYANHPNFIRRFEAEAQVIARLEHLHIVPLYDYWREPDSACLVMRWLRGGSLQQSIDHKGPWSTEAAAVLLDQIGSALDTAHRNGIIHRDLKPANILLDEENNAYLADFGIAKNLVAGPQEPSDEDRFGSPAFISPEQVMGSPVSPQTDIYSLGVVLYILLTGRQPFLDPDTTTVIRRQLSEPLPPIEMARPDLPHALSMVIWRATNKQPQTRFPDAKSLVAAFREAVSLDSRQPQAIYPTPELARPLVGVGGQTLPIELPPEPENPYRGLRAFEEADASVFFGRRSLIARLIKRLAPPRFSADSIGTIDLNPANGEPGERFLAIVGPSGSGKSSVARAGLIPALRRDVLSVSQSWFYASMIPGSQPFVELESALLGIAATPPGPLTDALRAGKLDEVIRRILPVEDSELVLLIDQFEEIFTQTQNEAEREKFLNTLLRAVTAPDSHFRLIITLRADLYDRPLLHPGFGDLMREHTEVVLPLNAEEMREAIIAPAERVGVRFEPGLVETIVADVSQQPGALPLLQYALTELFERREDRLLTTAAYQASGGVLGALARRADELYQSLHPEAQKIARQVFLRLVTPGEGTDDTRRRVLQSELNSIEGDKYTVKQVIDTFGKYRLLTFDYEPVQHAPTVEVAHEALIRTWERLRNWLDASRDELRIQRRLAAATAEWMNANRDSSFLASGSRLSQFENFVATTTLSLNDSEFRYVQASIAAREHAARRTRWFVAGLVVFSIAALILAVFAFNQRQTAVSEKTRADQQAAISRSRELAVTSLTGVQRTDLAMLLSLEALKTADTFEARNSLLTELQTHPRLLAYLQGEDQPVRTLAVSPDGRWLAAGDKGNRVLIWDTQTRKLVGTPFAGHTQQVNSVVFSADSMTLASASSDGTVRLWDVSSGRPIGQPLSGGEKPVWSVAFSPAGSLLAYGGEDQTIHLWDVAAAKAIGEPLTGTEEVVYALAFSPDGKTLASGGGDGMVRLWDAVTGKPVGEPLQGHSNWVMALAFSHNGQYLASGAADNSIILWDAQSGQALNQWVDGQSWVRSLTFSADDKRLISGNADHNARIWDIESGDMVGAPLTGHLDAVWSVALQPDGKTLYSGGADGQIITWDTQNDFALARRLTGHTSPVLSVAVSPDGNTVASAGGNISGDVGDTAIRLWDVQTGQQKNLLKGHQSYIVSLAFSPDGKLLASGSDDQTVRLWDTATGQTVQTLTEPDRTDKLAIAFSPDSKLLAAGGEKNPLILWDVATGKPSGDPFSDYSNVSRLAYSPDGKILAIGRQDGKITLLDAARRQAIGNALEGHSGEVSSLAFSADGKVLASGGADSVIMLWDVATGQKLLQPLVGHEADVLGLGFSPDGRILASGSFDGTMQLWDVGSGQRLGQPFVGHNKQPVVTIAYSPDGQFIASGGQDTTVVLWNVDPVSWEQQACRIANRNLTASEWERYFQGIPYHETCTLS